VLDRSISTAAKTSRLRKSRSQIAEAATAGRNSTGELMAYAIAIFRQLTRLPCTAALGDHHTC
jgi:hypothetical protein